MIRRAGLGLAVTTGLAAGSAWAAGPVSAPSSPAWSGTWVLDTSRPEPEGAADAYRLTIGPGAALAWEIPSIGERNTGVIGGPEMAVVRNGQRTQHTLRVWQAGPRILCYAFRRTPETTPAAGQMTLAVDGRSWTDTPLDHGRPVDRLTMVYLKR